MLNIIREIFHVKLDESRIYGLDIMRAMAIIFVMLAHGNQLLPKYISKYISFFILDGVSIFFVLSGFLIGRILIKTLSAQPINSKTLWNFWIRRWFRTLPNYFLVLFLLTILHLTFSDRFTISILPEYAIFVQNFSTPHPWFFPEAWSLSIEEWFYLLVPILILFFIRLLKLSVRDAVLLVVVGIIAGTTIFRYSQFLSLDAIDNLKWNMYFRKQVLTRLDSIMFGVIGAYLARYRHGLWRGYKKQFFVVGLLLFLTINTLRYLQMTGYGLYQCVFSFSLTALATTLLLPLLSTYHHAKRSRIYQSITIISLVSYSMYLINLTLVKNSIVGAISLTVLNDLPTSLSSGIQYGLYWIITISGSILIYKYFEVPIMKFRDRYGN